LFEHYAVQLAQNSKRGMKYTCGIRKENPGLYIYLSQLQKIIDDLRKIVEKIKKEGV